MQVSRYQPAAQDPSWNGQVECIRGFFTLGHAYERASMFLHLAVSASSRTHHVTSDIAMAIDTKYDCSCSKTEPVSTFEVALTSYNIFSRTLSI